MEYITDAVLHATLAESYPHAGGHKHRAAYLFGRFSL
jgi:hypothetical protein